MISLIDIPSLIELNFSWELQEKKLNLLIDEKKLKNKDFSKIKINTYNTYDRY